MVFGLLASCSTTSSVLCEKTNWYQRGIQLALDGQKKESQESQINECSKANLTNTRTRFDQGYAYGLKLFCRPDHAYQYGLQGLEYREICDSTKRAAFIEKYLLGRKNFLHQEIHEKKRLLSTIDDDIDFKKKLLQDIGQKELDEWTVPSEKEAGLTDEINDLNKRKVLVEGELKLMGSELSQLGKIK